MIWGHVSRYVSWKLDRTNNYLLFCCKAAPGKVSVTADGWTVDKMGKGFLGMTSHLIDVEKEMSKSGEVTQCWMLQSTVLGFRGIAGGHDSENLGRYFMGITDHADITGKDFLKVSHMHSPCWLISPIMDFGSCVEQPLTMHPAMAQGVKRLSKSTRFRNIWFGLPLKISLSSHKLMSSPDNIDVLVTLLTLGTLCLSAPSWKLLLWRTWTWSGNLIWTYLIAGSWMETSMWLQPCGLLLSRYVNPFFTVFQTYAPLQCFIRTDKSSSTYHGRPLNSMIRTGSGSTMYMKF